MTLIKIQNLINRIFSLSLQPVLILNKSLERGKWVLSSFFSFSLACISPFPYPTTYPYIATFLSLWSQNKGEGKIVKDRKFLLRLILFLDGFTFLGPGICSDWFKMENFFLDLLIFILLLSNYWWLFLHPLRIWHFVSASCCLIPREISGESV